MLTTFDKAWVSGVVAFLSNYIVRHFFGVDISPDIQGLIVEALMSLLPAVAVWFMPNKKPKSP